MKHSVLCIMLMNFVGMGAWASGSSSPEEPAMNAIRPAAIRAHMRNSKPPACILREPAITGIKTYRCESRSRSTARVHCR
jgi:hypothetical protein